MEHIKQIAESLLKDMKDGNLQTDSLTTENLDAIANSISDNDLKNMSQALTASVLNSALGTVDTTAAVKAAGTPNLDLSQLQRLVNLDPLQQLQLIQQGQNQLLQGPMVQVASQSVNSLYGITHGNGLFTTVPTEIAVSGDQAAASLAFPTATLLQTGAQAFQTAIPQTQTVTVQSTFATPGTTVIPQRTIVPNVTITPTRIVTDPLTGQQVRTDGLTTQVHMDRLQSPLIPVQSPQQTAPSPLHSPVPNPRNPWTTTAECLPNPSFQNGYPVVTQFAQSVATTGQKYTLSVPQQLIQQADLSFATNLTPTAEQTYQIMVSQPYTLPVNVTTTQTRPDS